MRIEQFDKWLSENFYPAMAGMCSSLEGYEMTGAVAKRYAELCAGKPENRFDAVLREKVYPVIAWIHHCSTYRSEDKTCN